jgi:peptide/nickel transport system substrate-binding protein
VGNKSSSGGGGGGAIRNGGTLTVALADDPDMLDPTQARTLVGRTVFASMCEKLYDIDEKINVVPQLAAGMPSLSDGGRTAEIKLRTGIKFNDDTPFDAEAVKKSLDRHRSLETSAPKSELLAIKSVEAVDPQTVRIHLSQPFAPLAAVLADRSGMVMSPKQLDKLGHQVRQRPGLRRPLSPAPGGAVGLVGRTS